jgi:serine protease
MTSPTPSSTLTGSSATFTWTTGADVNQYLMHVGTTGAGSSDITNTGSLHTTTATVTGIPTTGGTLYVRLYSYINGAWQYNDYTYTEYGVPTPAVMITPAPSSTLNSSSVTFTWTAGVAVSQYLMHVGTTGAGSSDITNTGSLHTTSTTITGIPTTGGTLYVRLYSYISGAWQYNDYTYTEQ